MVLDATEKLVEGNLTNGIAWNGLQYLVLVDGDKIGTFGSDITFARKVLKEKTGRDV